MRRAEQLNLLRRYMHAVWSQADPEAVQRFLDESFQRHVSPTRPPLGRDEQIARLQRFRDAFPDMQLELEEATTSGDLIWFRSTMRGTHQGEFAGVPATGREVTVHLVDVWRVAHGRILEQWGGPDMLDLLRQLGADHLPAL